MFTFPLASTARATVHVPRTQSSNAGTLGTHNKASRISTEYEADEPYSVPRNHFNASQGEVQIYVARYRAPDPTRKLGTIWLNFGTRCQTDRYWRPLTLTLQEDLETALLNWQYSWASRSVVFLRRF